MNLYSNNFANNLKNLRRIKKITQIELANKLSLSRTSIVMWESGQNYPSMDKLIELANIFDCSIDFLLGITSTNSQNLDISKLESEDQLLILSLYNRLKNK